MIKIGFTGTSRGTNDLQKAHLKHFLKGIIFSNPADPVEFHHGHCIGADDEMAAIAKEVGCVVIAHPGYPSKKPLDTTFRAANTWYNDVTLPAKDFISRDHDIVNETHFLVAAPHGEKEVRRSGTWTTVRYARKVGKQVTFCWPNRRMESDRL